MAHEETPSSAYGDLSSLDVTTLLPARRVSCEMLPLSAFVQADLRGAGHCQQQPLWTIVEATVRQCASVEPNAEPFFLLFCRCDVPLDATLCPLIGCLLPCKFPWTSCVVYVL